MPVVPADTVSADDESDIGSGRSARAGSGEAMRDAGNERTPAASSRIHQRPYIIETTHSYTLPM